MFPATAIAETGPPDSYEFCKGGMVVGRSFPRFALRLGGGIIFTICSMFCRLLDEPRIEV